MTPLILELSSHMENNRTEWFSQLKVSIISFIKNIRSFCVSGAVRICINFKTSEVEY